MSKEPKTVYLDPLKPLRPRIKIDYKRGSRNLIVTTTIPRVITLLLADPRFVLLERQKRPIAGFAWEDVQVKGVLPLQKDSPQDIIRGLLASPLLEKKEDDNVGTIT